MDEPTQFAKQPRTIIAAVVLVLAVIAGSWAVFSRGSGPEAAPAPSSPPTSSTPRSNSSAAPTTSQKATGYDSACGLTGGSTGPLTNTPAGVTWVAAQGWVLPRSETQGPAVRSATGPWSCFAHTPTGAALAAYVIPVRLGTAPNYRAVITQQTVPGVGQQSLLTAGRPSAQSSPITGRGVVVDSYTGDDATISLYVTSSGLGALTCSVNMQWFGGAKGDWRVRLEPNGDSYAGCVQNAPSSYVHWGPKS